MAYNYTSLNPSYIASIGVQPRLLHGIGTLVGGALTVTLPPGTIVLNAWAQAQTANAAYVSATSANTLTVTGTSTDVVAWFAIIK